MSAFPIFAPCGDIFHKMGGMYSAVISSQGSLIDLFVTNLSYSLNSGASPVLAQNSVYFTAPKPSQPTLDFQITQPSPSAMNATVGMLQRWSQKNALCRLQIPQLAIDYKGTLMSASYKWSYDNQEPAMDLSLQLATSLLYSDIAQANMNPNLWQYFTQSVVTKNVTQILNETNAINAHAEALQQEAQEQAAGIPDAVVSWLQKKLQFKGYSITYNSDGTISIEQNGIWAQNVKPSVALLKALKDGSYHVQIHAINPRDDWAA